MMSESHTIAKPPVLPKEKIKTPSMYVAVVHNDAFTPRGFVVEVLQACFQKNEEEAAAIMLRAHQGGHSVISTYTYEVAETKVAQANRLSLARGKMLLFSVEPA